MTTPSIVFKNYFHVISGLSLFNLVVIQKMIQNVAYEDCYLVLPETYELAFPTKQAFYKKKNKFSVPRRSASLIRCCQIKSNHLNAEYKQIYTNIYIDRNR